MTRTTGTSRLYLGNSWHISQVHAKEMTIDEIRLEGTALSGVDVDQLVIHELYVLDSSYEQRVNQIQLSQTSHYTIYNLSLQAHVSEIRMLVRGGIPTDLADLRIDWVCARVSPDSYLSVNYNETGFYATYESPTPDIKYASSDGYTTYLRIQSPDRYCGDHYFVHHLLFVIDHQYGLREITHVGKEGYQLRVRPGEDSCTYKPAAMTIYLKIILDLLPRNVVENGYYPWGNYNDADFWMGALSGDDAGKMRVIWNATKAHRPCGYEPQLFTLLNVAAPISQGELTLAAEEKHRYYSSVGAINLPTLSVVYSKDDHYIHSEPFVPSEGLQSIIPVKPSITPDNVDFTIEGQDLTWKASLPHHNCSCGWYSVIRDDQWRRHSTTLLRQYVMYVTGLCAAEWGGGYGRTIRREIILDKPLGRLNWVIPVSIAGGVCGILPLIAAVVFVIRKRRQRNNYEQIQ
ncbi:hypothetical protein PROFUN_07777 [Planoprotostelium fungivorum]|uniref:Uncharacterized protein n=1 Tax=Planoprotostelium fungivorum TaxID=1890364 RepID=A0A2P6MX24_9EUKA|nr:hypothetical protein PROFUN_07777 [Planoprotostelium fungivorum]